MIPVSYFLILQYFINILFLSRFSFLNAVEEIETSSITDVLTRFGADVVVASVKSDGELICKMSRGLKVCADITIEEASKQDWECIALPGGMPGASHLSQSSTLIDMIRKQNDKKKLVAAICASPAGKINTCCTLFLITRRYISALIVSLTYFAGELSVVLQKHGFLGKGATCYPAKAFRDSMEEPSDDKVCVNENIITSQGPGTSLLFALTLGEKLVSSNIFSKYPME